MNKYTDEVRNRWGGTAAYAEYAEKTKACSAAESDALASGLDRIMGAFAACMQSGVSPDSSRVRTLVKELQDYITAHYYTCTDEILAGLGQMYVLDERFRQNIDRHGEGTAQFICDAIGDYCERRK